MTMFSSLANPRGGALYRLGLYCADQNRNVSSGAVARAVADQNVSSRAARTRRQADAGIAVHVVVLVVVSLALALAAMTGASVIAAFPPTDKVQLSLWVWAATLVACVATVAMVNSGILLRANVLVHKKLLRPKETLLRLCGSTPECARDGDCPQQARASIESVKDGLQQARCPKKGLLADALDRERLASALPRSAAVATGPGAFLGLRGSDGRRLATEPVQGAATFEDALADCMMRYPKTFVACMHVAGEGYVRVLCRDQSGGGPMALVGDSQCLQLAVRADADLVAFLPEQGQARTKVLSWVAGSTQPADTLPAQSLSQAATRASVPDVPGMAHVLSWQRARGVVHSHPRAHLDAAAPASWLTQAETAALPSPAQPNLSCAILFKARVAAACPALGLGRLMGTRATYRRVGKALVGCLEDAYAPGSLPTDAELRSNGADPELMEAVRDARDTPNKRRGAPKRSYMSYSTALQVLTSNDRSSINESLRLAAESLRSEMARRSDDVEEVYAMHRKAMGITVVVCSAAVSAASIMMVIASSSSY